jgi:hypothetical protein
VALQINWESKKMMRSFAITLAISLGAVASGAHASDGLFSSGKFQWGQGYHLALGACPRIPRPGMRHDGAAPANAEIVKRFVHSVLWSKPEYRDMSPALANAVQKTLPDVDFPYLRRLAGDPTSVEYLGQRNGFGIFAVQMAGGRARGLAAIDAQGKVDASYLCDGGL